MPENATTSRVDKSNKRKSICIGHSSIREEPATSCKSQEYEFEVRKMTFNDKSNEVKPGDSLSPMDTRHFSVHIH